MNQEAESHLDKAAIAIKKGDEFYGIAADEIIAAKKADFDLTNVEIGQRFGRSETWVRDIVASRTKSALATTFDVDWRRGSHATNAEIKAGAEKLLDTMPAEEATDVIKKLTSRLDVIEHLANNPAAAERAVHGPHDEIIKRQKASTFDRSESGDEEEEETTGGAVTDLLSVRAKNQILIHLMKAFDLAEKNGLEDYLHEHVAEFMTHRDFDRARAEWEKEAAL